MKPFVIGAAGGSSSGKTTIITEIIKGLSNTEITTLQNDAYYKNNKSRKKEGIIKKPAGLIIIEGILIFVIKELRDLMDVRIFVDSEKKEENLWLKKSLSLPRNF